MDKLSDYSPTSDTAIVCGKVESASTQSYLIQFGIKTGGSVATDPPHPPGTIVRTIRTRPLRALPLPRHMPGTVTLRSRQLPLPEQSSSFRLPNSLDHQPLLQAQCRASNTIHDQNENTGGCSHNLWACLMWAQRDSNPQRRLYKNRALPLSYAPVRIHFSDIIMYSQSAILPRYTLQVPWP